MISVERYKGHSAPDQSTEMVERKGKGHPDTICDSVMEAASLALCAEYRRTFGRILHHNTDKALLAAGSLRKGFGGGKIVRPMELFMGDRAATESGGVTINAEEIAVNAAKSWIRENLRLVDPEKHVRFRSVMSQGSDELSGIFEKQGELMGANDTSALVGYWPLSPTERAVLAVEGFLNSEEFKGRHPETGEDVKVMGLRHGKTLDITVAMPLIAGHIQSEEEYFRKKEDIINEMHSFTGGMEGFSKIQITLNGLDERGRGASGIYLSLLGTSAEDADSGQVGRGNRPNGVISVGRPMSTEAAAGKNPVSHVGKIYNLLSHSAAREIYESIEGLKEVYVFILSRIGSPIDSPLAVSAQIIPKQGTNVRDLQKGITDIIVKRLSNISTFTEELASGKYPVC